MEAVAVKPVEEKISKTRKLSVDALRGFDMFWIVGAEEIFRSLEHISETGPTAFLARQFEHPEWEGFVFYDLIFPLFIFILGVSVVFSLDRILESEGKSSAYKRIFRRAALLFFLGFFYDEGFATDHGDNLLSGVLQRLSLVYLVTSLLYCNLKLKGLLVSFFVLILGYWALLSFIPVPGTGEVSFEPDVNWTDYVNYHLPPYYDTDNEGLLSTAPAVASGLLGVFGALLLKSRQLADRQKALIFIGVGAAMTILGYLWGLQMPIIKKLWTSSYVLVAGGYSIILLGIFYWIIDIRQYRRWATPFMWIGANSLAIYMMVNIIDPDSGFGKLAKRFTGGAIGDAMGPYADLVTTIVAMAMILFVVRYMYQKKIFIRL